MDPPLLYSAHTFSVFRKRTFCDFAVLFFTIVTQTKRTSKHNSKANLTHGLPRPLHPSNFRRLNRLAPATMREVYDDPPPLTPQPASTGLAYVIVRIFVFTVSGVARPLVGNVRTHKQRCNQRRDCIECEHAAAPRVSICFVAFYRSARASHRWLHRGIVRGGTSTRINIRRCVCCNDYL